MKDIIRLVLPLTISVSAHTKTYKILENTYLKNQIQIKSNHVESSKIKATLTQFKYTPELLYKYNQFLALKASLTAKTETGSNTSLFSEEYSPTSSIYHNEAYARLNLYNIFKLKAGAINQDILENPLLFSSSPGNGLHQSLEYTSNKFQVGAQFQQIIPNNEQLSKRLGNISQGTPRLYTSKLFAKLNFNKIEVKASVLKFSFHKLSSATAYQSQFLGNDISGSGQELTSFTYGFKGYSTYSHLKFNFLKDYSLKLYGNYLYNQNAPDSSNVGAIYGLKINLFKVSINAEFFENQKNSSIAFYNDKKYGHNNREGSLFSANYLFKNEFTLRVRYIQANYIDLNPYQADQSTYQLLISKKF